MTSDRLIGMKVLLAELNWLALPLHQRLMVLAFGRREEVTSLGYRVRLAWLWGIPYLLAISEGR